MLTFKPADAKRFFFDSKIVVEAMDRATRTVLSKFGAFVRTRARSSIRRRKKISEPGQPPSSHAGPLKELIFFAADLANQSVVIGPARFKDGSVPEILEYGGVSRIVSHGKTVKVEIEPRPFMHPAMEEEQKNLPPLWANSLR
jgi:hypothetical protein